MCLIVLALQNAMHAGIAYATPLREASIMTSNSFQTISRDENVTRLSLIGDRRKVLASAIYPRHIYSDMNPDYENNTRS